MTNYAYDRGSTQSEGMRILRMLLNLLWFVFGGWISGLVWLLAGVILAITIVGLAWAQGNKLEFLATAPCDAPLLPHDLFARLLGAIGDAPAAFAITASGAHPLCTVWRVRLRGTLERALTNGVHPSVRSFLAAIGARDLHFEDAHAFANANTLDALAALECST